MSDVIHVKGCTDINQLTQLTNPSLNHSNDRMAFFYNPPGDNQIYHITCENLRENIDPLSDHTFYCKINDKNFIRSFSSYIVGRFFDSPTLPKYSKLLAHTK